ncbi:hypothetical protein ROLI_045100 [Roseobacter fucihabitans]|uniref:Uncharacterized protein n=1 Tax=Roseobacter fucihabitans TaxID=1537242 RepID=A0ABZ2BZL1_9RHOB
MRLDLVQFARFTERRDHRSVLGSGIVTGAGHVFPLQVDRVGHSAAAISLTLCASRRIVTLLSTCQDGGQRS